MKIFSLFAALFIFSTATAAASYEDGLRYKQEEKFTEAAAAFSDVLTREPDHVKALQQLATVQGWLNRYDASIATWRRLLALAPREAAAHVGLARVLYWKGERAEALRELDSALSLKPGDTDTLILKGDVLLADGQAGAARTVYLEARALRGADAELDKKIERAMLPKLWRLDAGYIADDYSSVRGSEDSSYAQLGYAVSANTSLYLHFDRINSFGAVDQGVSVGGYFRVAPWLLLNAEAGTTPDKPDFRSKSNAVLNAEFLLDGPVQPLLGLRYLRYDASAFSTGGKVTTVTPGLRLLAGSASIELRYGYSDNLDGSKTGVFQSKLSLERENYSPYLAYAAGEEALPPQAKADVQVVGAGCVFNLSPSWGARVDLTHENRKNTYTHNALGLGLTYRF